MIHTEKVKKYKYLGSIINEDNDYTEEMKSKIGQARKGLCNRDVILV